MEIYRRYASREHDKRHFTNSLVPGHIKLLPLSASFDCPEQTEVGVKPVEYWQNVFDQAAFFTGSDPILFGPVIAVVYKNTNTEKLCVLSITKFGSNVYENLMLDSSSRFWPACQNLPENMRRSNVRRALAVSNLKNYNKLWNNKGLVEVTQHWDETNAGSLAAGMKLAEHLTAAELGNQILSMGLLQELIIPSLVVDVIYDSSSGNDNAGTSEDNNKLVLCLGEQLDLLFDPLLEYSPQAMDIEYQVPTNPKTPALQHNAKIEQVMDELISVQTKYTNDLVTLLQNFIIPLRVSVLATSSNFGMMKVNLAFPPTIDEITRVNCIVHYLLSDARQYGYVEVFKVLGSFLRFFYKAFVRHQANLSNFNSRFDKFVDNNFSYAFESPSINVDQLAPRTVKAIIVDSVLELPRLKLIIKRLYETINEEKIRCKTSKAARADEDAEIDAYYSSAMQVIDSFGFQEPDVESKARVFTPSGKLLTEWATDWPSELQYGWISRKVVGIFNLVNTKATTNGPTEVAIIFSDHILFLEVLGNFDDETSHILPDILMNSLINQKPLPKLSALPKLRVKFWCPITNLMVKSFKIEDGYCLCFTALSGNRLKNKDETEILFVENYRVPETKSSYSTCNKIIDVICKAQILCKSTPFHLFKYDEGELQRYFSAHEYDKYDEEVSKSPICLFLNMGEEQISSVMQKNPHLFFVLSISSINDHTVSLVGRDRHENLKIEEIVSLDDLKTSLKDIFFKAMSAMFHSSYFSKAITEGNVSLIKHFVESLSENDITPPKLLLESPLSQDNKETKSLNNESSNSIVEQKPAIEASHEQSDLSQTKTKRRKSGIFRILDKLKGKNYPKDTHSELKSIELSNGTRVTDSYIPKGKKKVYKNLYKPEPLLRDSSIASSVPVKEAKFLDPVETPVLAEESNGVTMEENHGDTFLPTVKQFAEPQEGSYPPESMSYPETRASSYATGSSSNYNESLRLEQVISEHMKSSSPDTSIMKIEGVARTSDEAPNSDSVNTTLYYPVEDAHNMVPAQAELIQVDEETPGSSLGSKDETTKVAALKYPNPAPLKMYSLQPSPERPAVPPHKVTSLLNPVKKRTVSGQEIAKALDNINAIGVLPDVHDRYKMYDALPNSVLAVDGSSNWTCIMSESSSNLQAELRAMKEEAHMDSEDVIVLNESVPEAHVSQANSSNHTLIPEAYSNIYSRIAAGLRAPQVKAVNDSGRIKREESTQSISSEQLVKEFSSRLDQEFDLMGTELENSISTLTISKLDPLNGKALKKEETLFHSLDFGEMDFDSFSSDESAKTHIEDVTETGLALGQKRQLLASKPSILVFEPLKSADSSTTDEEYFLTSEIMGLNYYLSDKITTGAPSSPSSEKTLKNEPNYMEQPEPFDNRLRAESVQYLSGILRGEIEI